MPKPSQIQILRTEFRAFKVAVLQILEELNNYNHEKDTLGPERVKSERLKALINCLKEGE